MVSRDFSTSAKVSPSSRITLCLDFSPSFITSCRRRNLKSLAKNSKRASFALPSTAGAVKRTCQLGSSGPLGASIPQRPALGTTLTLRQQPWAHSLTPKTMIHSPPSRYGFTSGPMTSSTLSTSIRQPGSFLSCSAMALASPATTMHMLLGAKKVKRGTFML